MVAPRHVIAGLAGKHIAECRSRCPMFTIGVS
jgi:hypothetical protein